MTAEKLDKPEQQHEISLSGSGTGTPASVSVFGCGQNITLDGKTDAVYDGGSFKTKNIKAKQAEGCEKEECVKITGTLAFTLSVKTTVPLPSVNDYAKLKDLYKAIPAFNIDDLDFKQYLTIP